MISLQQNSAQALTKINDAIGRIETTLIAQIILIDIANQLYTVQPILDAVDRTGTAIKRATIISCPFSHCITSNFGISNPFSIGDYVLVNICKESVEVALDTSQNTSYQHNAINKFRLVDGVIVGGLLRSGESVATNNLNNLVIYSRTGNSKITLTKTGEVIIDADKITINGNTTINGNLDISGTSTASDHISDGISGNSHTHPYTDDGNPMTTGSPN